MYDLLTIHGPHNTTYGIDQFGEYGTVFQPDGDQDIPPPLNFTPSPELDQIAGQNPNLQTPVTHRVRAKA